jgi:hypothetical protein
MHNPFGTAQRAVHRLAFSMITQSSYWRLQKQWFRRRCGRLGLYKHGMPGRVTCGMLTLNDARQAGFGSVHSGLHADHPPSIPIVHVAIDPLG